MSNIEFTNRNKNGIETKDGVLKTTYLTEYKSIDIYRRFINEKIITRLEQVKKEIKERKEPQYNTRKETKIFSEGYISGCNYCKIQLEELKLWSNYIPDQILSAVYDRTFHYVRSYSFEIKQQYAWRNQCLLRDGGCKKCGSKSNLVVHHIVPYKLDKELRWVVNNGFTMCEDCHKQFHKEYGVAANVEELFKFLYP